MLKMGSSPAAACNVSFFFFFSFQLLKNHPKNIVMIIIILFSSKPNKFILSIFFSSFTHCKTLKKISSNTSFFFHLILDHFVQNFSNTYGYIFSTLVFNIFPMLFTKHTISITIHNTQQLMLCTTITHKTQCM